MEATPVTFLSPSWLWLLLLVAASAIAYIPLQRRRRHYAVRFTNLDLLATVAPHRPGWRRHVPAALLGAALATLVVGVARPARTERVPREEATVVLAIDTSLSMDATDVTPTRLVAAQNAARDFVENLPPRFRLGLVTFDGVARVLVSPTEDREQVNRALDTLELGQRTAAGEAVFAALQSIESSTTAAAPDGAGARAARIVLMSDGATTSGRSVEEAAAAASEAKVPISTISFGTDDGIVEVQGRVVPVPVDRESMRFLAETTSGRFFEAQSGDQLRDVYRDIGSAIGYRTVRNEVTAAFTGLALALAAAGIMTGLAWTGRIL